MKRETLKRLSLLAVIPLLLASCASYSSDSLASLSAQITGQSQKGGLAWAAKEYTEADCKTYLGRNVILSGYQPVQLYIKNDSDTTYRFSPDAMSIQTVNYREVAVEAHTNTFTRVLLYAPLILPAIFEGIGSSKANAKLDSDYADKSAKTELIAPYGTLNKILFVPEYSYQDHFTVTLLNVQTNKHEVITVFPMINQ